MRAGPVRRLHAIAIAGSKGTRTRAPIRNKSRTNSRTPAVIDGGTPQPIAGRDSAAAIDDWNVKRSCTDLAR